MCVFEVIWQFSAELTSNNISTDQQNNNAEANANQPWGLMLRLVRSQMLDTTGCLSGVRMTLAHLWNLLPLRYHKSHSAPSRHSTSSCATRQPVGSQRHCSSLPQHNPSPLSTTVPCKATMHVERKPYIFDVGLYPFGGMRRHIAGPPPHVDQQI